MGAGRPNDAEYYPGGVLGGGLPPRPPPETYRSLSPVAAAPLGSRDTLSIPEQHPPRMGNFLMGNDNNDLHQPQLDYFRNW